MRTHSLVISKQGPQRVREWNQWLETLHSIDSTQRMEFDLGDEPPPLIEDLAQDFALEIQVDESDKDGIENDNDELDIND